MRKLFISPWLMLVLAGFFFVLIPASTLAKEESLNIHQVFVDFGVDPYEIVIKGENFLSRGDPVVIIQSVEEEVLIISANDEEIIAELPYLEDGDYRLIVHSGEKDKDKALDTYDLTIGAVGPQGPPGPQGPRGFLGVTAEMFSENFEVPASTQECGDWSGETCNWWYWTMPSGYASIRCPEGSIRAGGGVSIGWNNRDDVNSAFSYPAWGSDYWTGVIARNRGTTTEIGGGVYINCLTFE